jgi:hypothetical protein
MNLTAAIAVQVQGLLTSTGVNHPMVIACLGEKVVDAITIGLDTRPTCHYCCTMERMTFVCTLRKTNKRT